MNITKRNKRRLAFARVNKPRWWLKTIEIPLSWLEDRPCWGVMPQAVPESWREAVANWTPTFEAFPFDEPYVPFGLNARIIYGAKK